MARSLSSKTNVIAPNPTDFEFGRIKDGIEGVTPGTPINEAVYGDMHQFFEKLLFDAGATANGNPENKVNGYQYNDSLKGVFANLTPNSSYTQDSTSPLQIAKTSLGTIKIRGSVNMATFSNNIVTTLPTGFVPSGPLIFLSVYFTVLSGSTVTVTPSLATILSGQITLQTTPPNNCAIRFPEQHITL